MTKRIRKRIDKPLVQFIVFFISTMFILAGVSFSTVLSIKDIYEDTAISQNQTILDHTVESIDNVLDTVYTFNSTLLSNRNLMDVLGKRSNVLISEITQSINNLPLLNDSNHLISDYFIFSNQKDLVLAPKRAYIEVDLYYNTHFKLADLTIEEWKDLMTQGSQRTIMLPMQRSDQQSNVKDVILLLIPFKNINTGRSIGCTAYFIDSSGIDDLLTANSRINEIAYQVNYLDDTILLANGEMPVDALYSEEGRFDTDQSTTTIVDNILYTYHSSQSYGIDYIIGVQQSYFVRQAWESALPQILVMAIVLVVSLTILMRLFVINWRPLSAVVKKLIPGGEIDSELDTGVSRYSLWALDEVASKLMVDKKTLETEIALREIERKNILIDRFINGETVEADDLYSLLNNENPAFETKGNRACIIQFSFPNSDISADAIDLHLTQALLVLRKQSEMTFLKQYDNNSMLFIFHSDDDPQQLGALPLFRNIRNHFNDLYNFHIRFCLGTLHSDIDHFHYSFTAAERLMDVDFDGRYMLVYDAIYELSDQYFYSSQTEQKLKSLLLNGKEKDCFETIDKVYHDNFVTHHLLSLAKQKLFIKLLSTISDFDEIVSVENMIRVLKSDARPDTYFQALKDYCSELCRYQDERNKRSQAELVNKILAYISEQMSDPNMSLTLLSIQFGMTEKYLSAYIKDNTGITFSAHLEKLRLNEANQLLLETDLPIKEIAERVGYLNDNSFRRWYQRLQGIAPSEFRQSRNT